MHRLASAAHQPEQRESLRQSGGAAEHESSEGRECGTECLAARLQPGSAVSPLADPAPAADIPRAGRGRDRASGRALLPDRLLPELPGLPAVPVSPESRVLSPSRPAVPPAHAVPAAAEGVCVSAQTAAGEAVI